MKVTAALFVVLVGCARPSTRQHTLPELTAMRERARSTRTLAIVGIAVGIAATIAGVVLTDHGIDVRARESSADDEDGLGALLGGMLLVTGGGVLAIGSGVGFATASFEHDEVDRKIRMWPSSASDGQAQHERAAAGLALDAR